MGRLKGLLGSTTSHVSFVFCSTYLFNSFSLLLFFLWFPQPSWPILTFFSSILSTHFSLILSKGNKTFLYRSHGTSLAQLMKVTVKTQTSHHFLPLLSIFPVYRVVSNWVQIKQNFKYDANKNWTIPLSIFMISWKISSNYLHPPEVSTLIRSLWYLRSAAMRTQSRMSVFRVCLPSEVLSISNEAYHFGSFKGVLCVYVHVFMLA